MALIFNPVLTTALANSFYFTIKNVTPIGNNSGNTNVYLYSSDVPYPDSCPTTVPAGFLAVFANVPNAAWSIGSGTVFLNSFRTANANVTGNVNWWLMTATSNTNAAMCSNSVSSFGGNGMLTLDNMSTTANNNITLLTFSMAFSPKN
jgi:hypothetical protein